jgi:hypothetical protein
LRTFPLTVKLTDRRPYGFLGEFSVNLAERRVGFFRSVGIGDPPVVIDSIQPQQGRHIRQLFQQRRESFQRAVLEIVNRALQHEWVRKSKVTGKNVTGGGPACVKSGILF